MGSFHPSSDLRARTAFAQAIDQAMGPRKKAEDRRAELEDIEQRLRAVMQAVTERGPMTADKVAVRDRLVRQMENAIRGLRHSSLDD